MATLSAKKNSANAYAPAISRSCAALLGGYAASFVITFSMARILVALGVAQANAAAASAMASFLIWLALGVYAFGARSALRAWLLPLFLIAVFGGVAALLGKPQASAAATELPG